MNVPMMSKSVAVTKRYVRINCRHNGIHVNVIKDIVEIPVIVKVRINLHYSCANNPKTIINYIILNSI